MYLLSKTLSILLGVVFGGFVVLGSTSLSAQTEEDLLNSLNNPANERHYTFATFKSTRVVNGHSVEQVSKKHLDFRISHRFGQVNTGAHELWGLDQAYVRLGFEYGLSDRIMLGLGRSNINKMYDGFTKIKLLRQQTGAKQIPVSISYFGSMAINSAPWPIPNRDNLFHSRLFYANQLLIARKFNERLSLQISPSHVHRNLVEKEVDDNSVFAIGYAGRVKLSKRISLNAEFFQILSPQTAKDFYSPLSLGLDIETGGHVFQLFLSNAVQMIEKGFIAETTGSWAEGGVHFGFNISRVFSFDKTRNTPNNW